MEETVKNIAKNGDMSIYVYRITNGALTQIVGVSGRNERTDFGGPCRNSTTTSGIIRYGSTGI